MDRMPRFGSGYRKSHSQYDSPTSSKLAEKLNRRSGRHRVSLAKKIVNQLNKLNKSRGARLTKLRQKNIASPLFKEKTKDRKSALNSTDKVRYKDVDNSRLPLDKKKSESKALRNDCKKDLDLPNIPPSASDDLKIVGTIGQSLAGLNNARAQHAVNNVRHSDQAKPDIDFYGKSIAAGQAVNKVIGTVSAFEQIYDSEESLSKTNKSALDLLDATTLEQILEERKGQLISNRPITQGELKKYIKKTLVNKAKNKTMTAGLTGTFTLVGFIGTVTLLFPPLLPLLPVAAGIGLLVIGIFRRINKNRVKKKLNLLFLKIDKEQSFEIIKKSFDEKINALNKQLIARREKLKSSSYADDTINYSELADNTLFSLQHASGFIKIASRFISVLGHVASAITSVTSILSVAFTGIKNYKDRQKKLEHLDNAMMGSLIPSIMGRTFPYIKPSAFDRFVLENKQAILPIVGFDRPVSNKVFLERIDTIECRNTKKKLQNECIKRCLKERFCSYVGINKKLFETLSETKFNNIYSLAFYKFVRNKVAGSAFRDTLRSGVSGTLTVSLGILALSGFPGLMALVFPAALATVGIGMITVLAAARREQIKFREKMDGMIGSGEPIEAIDTYNNLKKLVLEKNTILSS
ncbi:MAG: hypothetical protein PUP46_08135 [Endozoicomonas sp. (ex Botrylloides leachii)]|nr:hypothetical protein [Endozoicomonas sp. (ex Botrylloides leachii)]